MSSLYLDLISGISGDMFLGALLDLGVDAHRLEHELEKLGLHEYHLHISRRQKGSITGTKFDVHLESEHHHGHEDAGHAHPHAHPHEPHSEHGHAHEHEEHDHHEHHGRTFADIEHLIHHSTLSDWVKQKSIAVFRRVAIAEGKIHGHPPEQVHFHEVGAIDSIVDIVGACIALELLGKPRVLASPVTEGTGWVECAHGRFPVPTLATLEILGARGIAVTQCDEPHELVTPTGAALLAEFVESFGLMHGLRATKVGYGLGTRDLPSRPNVLRAVWDDSSASATPQNDWETDTIAVLETNLDDLTAEVLGHFMESAMQAGALDVFYTPAQMKKNRPGVLLTVLCALADADRFSELILRETSAFGVRRFTTERRKLQREIIAVQTTFGEVQVKLGKLNGKIVQAAPEFESCRRVALAARVPLHQIQEAATRALNHLPNL